MRQDERPVIPAEFWHALFRARSIAVIGASDVTGSWGYDIMNAALASARSKGRHVFPVNPNLKEVLGQKAYPTILDIPEAVELAIIAVPARIVPQVFRQCAEKGVKAAVIITAGFAEVDSAGAKLQEEIVAIAREHNLHFTGPNCVGHADMHSRLASISFATTAPAGSMALVSQSGTLGASILLMAISRGIGISKFVSTGNEADLHLEDYLEYLARDEETKIIALYIEGLRQGRRFYELARKTTPQKPILAIKSGGTSAAAQAVRSHTGALAGSDAVYSAAFRQSGVIRVQDEEELCDTALALLRLPLPRGRRVGILTIGGGFGVMTAELCEKEGLEIAPLEERTLKAMAAVLPPRWTPGNPVDLVGVRPTGGGKTGDAAADDPGLASFHLVPRHGAVAHL
ncbi:MAG: CoA-binding protein, partial [Dehalococcoidales bacterium]|nr:CoA-binding protein [Dehalococcoidales bacterium]